MSITLCSLCLLCALGGKNSTTEDAKIFTEDHREHVSIK